MRFRKKFSLFSIFITFFLHNTFVLAQDLATVTPTSISYGVLPTSSNVIRRIVNITPNPQLFLRVKSFKWISGNANGVISVTGLNVNDIISPSGKKISFDGKFLNSGFIKGVFQIELLYADGGTENIPPSTQQTITISVNAKVDCLASNPDCRPKGRECLLDVNNDYHIFFENGEYPKAVSEPLTKVHGKHNSGYNPYQLPVSLVWDVIGLKDLLEEVPVCCSTCREACIKNVCKTNCVSDIEFNRVQSSPILATFIWSAPNGQFTVKSKQNPLYDIELKIPSAISGQAIVGADYYELHFSSLVNSPKLSIKLLQDSGEFQAGDMLYDGNVQCIASSGRGAFVKNPADGISVPDTHLYTSDKPAN